jgi:hypothetical protein
MNKPRLILDIEVYINYFLVMFLSEDGRGAAFEMYEGHPLDGERIRALAESDTFEVQTFNGNGFDVPLLRYALAGATCEQLKVLADRIITDDQLKPWDIERQYELAPLAIDHVDLIEVAPGQNSLKIYGARLHCPVLQDLPIDPAATIQPEQRSLLKRYCLNDLRVTLALSDALGPELALRRQMNADLAAALAAVEHGHLMDAPDVRSKSDAQIAETVLKQRVFLKTGAIPRKQRDPDRRPFFYKAPEYITFRTEQLQRVKALIESQRMVLGDTGHVVMPKAIDDLEITIGATTYKIGIGGLHSQESSVSHYASDTHYLRDIDVRSYYPNLMLNMGMYPISIGPHFLEEYRAVLTERLAAKDAGEKTKDSILKIVLNGTFGKTSSKFSILYNPSMMLHTTITGQLSVLMLIEALETRTIPVVSANTDGIVILCPRHGETVQRRIVKAWEQITNLETEETDYLSIHARDVNSYVAIKTDGKVKTKGAFAVPKTDRERLAKSPQNEICLRAVTEYLTNKTPVAETIRACSDITQFVTVRRVTGGAEKDGQMIGKSVRWYYSTSVKGVLRYALNGNAVPRTARAKVVNDLPAEFPSDVDFDWYIAEAEDLLADLAVLPRKVVPKLPRRNTKVWKALEKDGIVGLDDYGKPTWTVRLEEIPPMYANVH